VGRKLKSPVELALGLLRCLQGTTNTVELAKSLQQLGQGLLLPPSVKGWDGGRTWINSSTLLGRSNLMRRLITSENTRFGRLPLRDHSSRQDCSSRPIFWLSWNCCCSRYCFRQRLVTDFFH
jgi:hypothetical protein